MYGQKDAYKTAIGIKPYDFNCHPSSHFGRLGADDIIFSVYVFEDTNRKPNPGSKPTPRGRLPVRNQ